MGIHDDKYYDTDSGSSCDNCDNTVQWNNDWFLFAVTVFWDKEQD